MITVALFGDFQLARPMITGFVTMFSTLVGFGSGYLLGKNGG
jgi:hypothetical protein